MKDLRISEMMEMQSKLWSLHQNNCAPMEAAYARDSVLWMIEELGEVIAIIKKKGDQAIMSNPDVRAHFLEEMSDVLMYYHDALMRYGVSAEEISKAYVEKHERNLTRFF